MKFSEVITRHRKQLLILGVILMVVGYPFSVIKSSDYMKVYDKCVMEYGDDDTRVDSCFSYGMLTVTTQTNISGAIFYGLSASLFILAGVGFVKHRKK